MADLAGNAMTSTIVGTCLLAALLLGKNHLIAFEQAMPEGGCRPSTEAPKSPAKKAAKAAAALSSPELPRSPAGGLMTSNGVGLEPPTVSEAAEAAVLQSGALELAAMATGIDLDELLDGAARSCRMCVSEGRDGISPDILKCAVSGYTVSKRCAGVPVHEDLKPLEMARLAPSAYEETLKSVLPMCVELSGLADRQALDAFKPSGNLLGAAPAADAPVVSDAPAAARPAEAAPAPAEAAPPSAKGKGKGKAAAEGGSGTPASSGGSAKPAMKQMGIMGMFSKKKEPPKEPAADEEMEEAEEEADKAPAKKKGRAESEEETKGAKEAPPAKKAKGGKGSAAKPLSEEEQLWNAWCDALGQLAGKRFYFESVTRAGSWTATYRCGVHGSLQLVLSATKAEWRLYATPPAKRGHLRTLLESPVARMIVDPADPAVRAVASAGGVSAQLLGGAWQLCLPTIRTVPLVVGAVGTPVDSWQASIGLCGPWEGHSRYRTWRISCADGARAALDGDVSGEYELLDQQYGGAMGSLHKRVSGGDGKPMFFFLDPSRTGKEDEDHFVFAPSFERLGYGQSRQLLAELPVTWRPWEPTPGKQAELRDANSSGGRPKAISTKKGSVLATGPVGGKKGDVRPAEQVIDATVRGLWKGARALVLKPVRFAEATLAAPAKPPPLDIVDGGKGKGKAAAPAEEESTGPAAVPLVRCSVPLLTSETAEWPMGRWGLIPLTRSKAAFGSIAWITERLTLPESCTGWSALLHPKALAAWSAGRSPCEACAPQMPKLEWVAASRSKIVAVEDPVQAGAYEQRLKRRPPAFVVERRADARAGAGGKKNESAMEDVGAGNVDGAIRISANPMALAMRALGLLSPSGLASQATLEWRLIKHNDQPIALPPLKLSSNKKDAPAPQPEHFKKFKLRIEQQRSLSWMLRQEAEDCAPFIETEVAEATLPALRWRLEARASMPRIVRGGVLADEVGYGKTVITIALIDATPRVPRPPPPPLRAEGFIPVRATLVLAPSHLLKQWPKEVTKFSGGALKCVTISTMADINKLSIKDIQSVDVVVASITLLRNDLYFSRLANLAGSDALPQSKTNMRHFGAAYANSMEALQEQVARLCSGAAGVKQARQAVKDGQARRKAQREGAGKGNLQKLGNMQKRMANGVQLDGVQEEGAGLAVALKGKKATYAAEKKAAKAKVVEAEDEEDEDEDEDESDDDDDDDESDADSDEEGAKKRKKPPAKKGAAAKPKAEEKEEADPWGLFQGKADKDYSSMKAAPLELFYWNRLVVDEYTYNKERDYSAIVHGLQASSRWVLSGTPDISGFAAVNETAQWLGLHLGSADAADLTSKEKKEQSAVERFQYFRDAHTPSWYAERHGTAQKFLDVYVRQNIAEIDEIPWREQAVKIALPAAERALYVELQNHLEALDMKNNHKTIKSKCKSENDRESRLAQVLTGSECPEEALLKRCAHFDMEGKAKTAAAACDAIIATRQRQLEACKAELVRQVAFARDCIKKFEDSHPTGKMSEKDKDLRASPAANFKMWREAEVLDCGDLETNDMMGPLVQQGLDMPVDKKVKISDKEKNLKDQMAWTRDQVHLLRRLQKEVTGRVRSLRFFDNVRKLQNGEVGGLEASSGAGAFKGASPGKRTNAPAAPTSLGLLSCCGHVGEFEAVRRAAAEYTCHVDGCKAPARPSCVISVSELGVEGRAGAKEAGTSVGGSGSVGVKIASVIKLVKSIPTEERVLIFVQFPDLLAKVAEALKEHKLPAAQLTGTPNQRSSIIDCFQQPTLKPGEPRVLLLNLRDESAAGANLTAASHALFVHPLLVNSQQEYSSCDTQAVGRVRRYGQSRTVQLYRFLVANSIDEDIFRQRRAEDAEELLATAATGESVTPLD